MNETPALLERYGNHYQRVGNRVPSDEVFIPALRHEYERPWMKGLAPDAAIFDCGCGSGRQLYALSRMGFKNIFGIDVAEELLTIARADLDKSVKLVNMDAFEFLGKNEGKFDVVILNDVLEHIPRERTVELLRLIHTALRPGGIVNIRVPNMGSILAAYSMYLDFTHVVGFTEYSLMQLLDEVTFSGHTIISSRPRVFFNIHYPLKIAKSLVRLFLYAGNVALHKSLYLLRWQRPMPTQFGYNVEIFSYKQ